MFLFTRRYIMKYSRGSYLQSDRRIIYDWNRNGGRVDHVFRLFETRNCFDRSGHFTSRYIRALTQNILYIRIILRVAVLADICSAHSKINFTIFFFQYLDFSIYIILWCFSKTVYIYVKEIASYLPCNITYIYMYTTINVNAVFYYRTRLK